MGIAHQRGSLLYDQKRYAMAADEFRKELMQNPTSCAAMSMLALSLIYDNKIKEGIEQAKAAVAANPQRGFAHYTLACAIVGPSRGWSQIRSFRLFRVNGHMVAYRRRLRKAKVPAMEAIRLEPRNPDFIALMAGIELDLRRPKETLKWAGQGLAVQPDHVRCTNLRGRALAKLGRVQEAREAVQSALALAPQSASTHASSGWTHLQAGDPHQAVQHFTESVRLNPTDVNVQQGLKAARRSASRTTKAFSGLGILGWGAYLTIRATAMSSDPSTKAYMWVIFTVAAIFFGYGLWRRTKKWIR
jgi:tetratricopeptide (TPR) repeat protein